MRQIKEQSELLQVLQKLALRNSKSIGKDILRCTGKNWSGLYIGSPEKLLRKWQSFYLKKQQRAYELISLYKIYCQDFAEYRNLFCDQITLVERDETPVSQQDASPTLIQNPEFEEINIEYEGLPVGSVSSLDGDIEKLPEKSTKTIGKVFETINRLGLMNMKEFSKMLRFRKLPSVLPQVTNLEQRPSPIKINILGSLTGFFGHILLIIYVLAILSEAMVFVNLGTRILDLELWEAALYAGAMVGVSYLLALLFYDPMLKFLRSIRFIPWIYFVFLGISFVFIISAGYLNYQMLIDDRITSQAELASTELQSLQLMGFINPDDAMIQTEISEQKALVNSLEEDLQERNGHSLIAQLLLITVSLLSLLNSGLLLAVKIIVSNTSKLYRRQRKAQLQIAKCQAEYQSLADSLYKLRELMGLYCFEIGRYMAIKTMIAYPPNLDDFTSPKNTVKKTTAPRKPIKTKVNNPSTFLVEEENTPTNDSSVSEDLLDDASYNKIMS